MPEVFNFQNKLGHFSFQRGKNGKEYGTLMSPSDQPLQHLFGFQRLDYYEHADDYILCDQLIRNGSVIGQVDVNDDFSLPPVCGNENHVFDRGKN